MDRWAYIVTDGQRTWGWTNGRMADGRTDERTDGWKDGRTEGQPDGCDELTRQ